MTQLNNEEIRRYARHLMLPEIGAAGQERIKKAKVLCVGAGGLGSPVLLYLAAAGVGCLGIADFDSVDLTNLQRQIAHGNGDLGRLKTDSGRDAVLRINPNIKVEAHPERLTETNIMQIVDRYDIIVDGGDNFTVRYLIHDAGYFLKKTTIYGAVFRFEGQASIFAPHQGGPCYRCLFPQPPPSGMSPSCAEAGVMGVLPGVIGCIQATEAVKAIVGIGRSLAGRLMVYDALEMRFRELKVRKDPGCPLCGEKPTIQSVKEAGDLCPGKPMPDDPDLETGMDELQQAIGQERCRIIDIRDSRERDLMPIHGAIALDAGSLPESIAGWNKDLPIYVICQAGVRSLIVARVLRENGFSKAKSIRNGMKHWQ